MKLWINNAEMWCITNNNGIGKLQLGYSTKGQHFYQKCH